jgi:hypothetical protein
LHDTTEVFFRDIIINSILKDKRGNYWLSTHDKGVLYIPDMAILNLKTAGTSHPRLLAANKNRLFTLQEANGLKFFSLSPAGKLSQVFELPATDKKPYAHFLVIDTLKNSLLAGASAYDIDPLSDNNILKTKLLSYAQGPFRNVALFGRNIYIAGNNNWGTIDETGKTVYSSIEDGFSAFCSAICVDSSHTTWIGTSDGLFYYYNKQTRPYRPENNLFRQRITDIKCSPEGWLIVSTRGNGIIVIDKENIYNITTQNGLSTNLCGKITVQGNTFWACSNNGLNKVVLEKKANKLHFKISVMQATNGLPSNLIFDAIPYHNFMVVATGKGLTWFDPECVFVGNYVPPVYIDKVTANERILEKESDLSYNENNISFSFTGLLYNNPGKVVYRYKIEGHEQKWHTTTERNAHYFNLPAGNYRFIVAAKNERGDWSVRPATFSFSIPLHYTKTWWFRTSIVLSALIILSIAIGYYLKQRRIRERITSDRLLAELNALRSQMKPHFIFNSLNSVQHFILENDEESAHLYLSRFAELIRKILDNTQKNTISLAQEIETLELYLSLEKMRFGINFDYNIAVAPGIIPDAIEIPPMLIQPYVENAIWHGLLPKKENANLWLRFSFEGHTLICEIEDNGIGRKKAGEMKKHKHRSTGMKNIEERIDILNRVSAIKVKLEILDLMDENGNPEGTRIILRFKNALEKNTR